MKVQEERLIKVPLDEIRSLVKAHHGVDLSGIEPYLDKDSLVFAIQVGTGEDQSQAHAEAQAVAVDFVMSKPTKVRRRRRKRNRIRTRGWNVVAKITNSKGLVANIYEPLVEALDGKQITKSEQRKIVRQLLISNGNDPSEESVDYFLSNTLEYLENKAVGATVVHAD